MRLHLLRIVAATGYIPFPLLTYEDADLCAFLWI